jgi:hypothetical protein
VFKGTAYHDGDDEGARAVKDDKCSKQDSRAFFTRRLGR